MPKALCVLHQCRVNTPRAGARVERGEAVRSTLASASISVRVAGETLARISLKLLLSCSHVFIYFISKDHNYYYCYCYHRQYHETYQSIHFKMIQSSHKVCPEAAYFNSQAPQLHIMYNKTISCSDRKRRRHDMMVIFSELNGLRGCLNIPGVTPHAKDAFHTLERVLKRRFYPKLKTNYQSTTLRQRNGRQSNARDKANLDIAKTQKRHRSVKEKEKAMGALVRLLNDKHRRADRLLRQLSEKECQISIMPIQFSVASPEKECSICLLKHSELVLTRCKHLFCQSCIEKWVVEDLGCPECSTSLMSKRISSFRVMPLVQTAVA